MICCVESDYGKAGSGSMRMSGFEVVRLGRLRTVLEVMARNVEERRGVAC